VGGNGEGLGANHPALVELSPITRCLLSGGLSAPAWGRRVGSGVVSGGGVGSGVVSPSGPEVVSGAMCRLELSMGAAAEATGAWS
jgi:hypothetical protein